MNLLSTAELIIYMLESALAVVGSIMAIWAFADAARRPASAFEQHTRQAKSTWMLILMGALIFGLGSASMTVLLGGRMGLFGMASIVAAGVYLAGPRREFQMWSY